MRAALLTIGALVLALALSACEERSPVCSTQTDCFAGERCVHQLCVQTAVFDAVPDVDVDVDVAPLADTKPDSDTREVVTPDVGDCRAVPDLCGRRICNTSNGECEPCQWDELCGANAFCLASGACACRAGSHYCDGACLADDDVASCGAACTPCPTELHTRATCVGGECGLQCVDGTFPCPGVCDGPCVECLSDADCPLDSAAACVDGTCVPCTDDNTCLHLDPLVQCDGGRCVECSVLENRVCSGMSCNPATGRCTKTSLGSVDWCERCVADSECMDGHRCVPMEYKHQPRADGYCLPLAGSGCQRPLPVQVSRVSLSGGPPEYYCGIREDLTTCEAVRDYGRVCAAPEDCGTEGLPDGLCKPFDGGYWCTYDCASDNDCVYGGTFCASLYCRSL